MAKIKLNGDTSGYIEISAPAVSGNNTLELGPGTKILTNLDNTFTGVSTFTSGLHVTGGGFILNQQRSDTHASLIIDKPDAGTGTIKFFNNGSDSAYIQHTNAERLDYYLPSGSGSQVFYTNATERLRITSTGIVQIATDAVDFANGTGYITAKGSGDLIFRTTNSYTERLRITSNGNIGVGGATGTDYSLLDGIVTNTANGSAGLLINSSSSSHNAYISFGYGSGSGTSHADQFSAYIGRVGDNTLILGTDNNIRLRLDSSGHLLHGVTADEDTSGNGGLRFINSGDIQIDGDQKALVFRSTNNTAQLQSAIEWWNENGAGVQSKIACDRTAVSQAPSDLVFYTSSNVDLGGAGSDGAITERLRIRSDGRVTIGAQVINTNSMLSIHRGSSDESQIRFTNTTTGEGGNNGLLVGIDSNEHGRIFNQENTPLRFGTNNTERVRISSDGNFGIGVQSPFSRLQSGGHTFSGGHGLHNNSRVGMSNHGNLTGLMLASTYNDANHPEYGLVFVQGPNTSSYNVWSVSPDGPAKGNSLNFHYDDQATNIHAPGLKKFEMTGDGYFLKPNQPSFHAVNTTIGQINTDLYGTIVFNDVTNNGNHNIGSHYNTSNGRFTAPIAGRYLICARSLTNSAANSNPYVSIFVRLNGNIIGYIGHNHTDSWLMESYSGVLSLAANDYVDVYVNQASAHGGQYYSSFSGHLLS